MYMEDIQNFPDSELVAQINRSNNRITDARWILEHVDYEKGVPLSQVTPEKKAENKIIRRILTTNRNMIDMESKNLRRLTDEWKFRYGIKPIPREIKVESYNYENQEPAIQGNDPIY